VCSVADRVSSPHRTCSSSNQQDSQPTMKLQCARRILILSPTSAGSAMAHLMMMIMTMMVMMVMTVMTIPETKNKHDRQAGDGAAELLCTWFLGVALQPHAWKYVDAGDVLIQEHQGLKTVSVWSNLLRWSRWAKPPPHKIDGENLPQGLGEVYFLPTRRYLCIFWRQPCPIRPQTCLTRRQLCPGSCWTGLCRGCWSSAGGLDRSRSRLAGWRRCCQGPASDAEAVPCHADAMPGSNRIRQIHGVNGRPLVWWGQAILVPMKIHVI